VHIFEILLALSVLFGADLKSKTSERLLETCVDIFQSASIKLDEIEKHDYVLKNLVNSKLMRWICSGLNFSSIFKAN